MLQDVAHRCPSFRFSKEETRNVLKDIAEFKAPGVYVLTEYTQKYELPVLEREFGTQTRPGKLCSSCMSSRDA